MDLLKGLYLDSFRTSHPISVPVQSPDEINDIFDRISYSKVKWCCHTQGTIMILSFWTDRSGQTLQTQIRLLLEEQSDQGLNCLLFHLHLFDEIP